MDTHVKVTAWLWLVWGALGVLSGLCIGGFIAMGGLISQDETAMVVTPIVGTICGGFIILQSAAEVVAGVGLLRYRPWSRILAIVLGILNLFSLPVVLPALLGIYTLVIMFNSETKELFEAQA